MRRIHFILGLIAALMLGARAYAASYEVAGPLHVAVTEGVWHDAGRGRDVPYLIRYPSDGAGPFPVVVFSHGLGGSARGAPYYGDHLASHGYVVVYVQHPGSDTAVWRGVLKPGMPFAVENVDVPALARTVANPKVTLDRFGDIPFALAQIAAINIGPGPLHGRIDTTREGMSGHSFGAVTTQAMAGQVFPTGASVPRTPFKAFLAMSPSSDQRGNDERAFSRFDRPFLFLTGTKDDFSIRPNDTDVAKQRLRPYEVMKGAPATLVVLTGGDHMVFSGRQETGRSLPKDERFRTIVKAASLAFWDAYLKGDEEALRWLRDGRLTAFAGDDARVESKGPPR